MSQKMKTRKKEGEEIIIMVQHLQQAEMRMYRKMLYMQKFETQKQSVPIQKQQKHSEWTKYAKYVKYEQSY